MTALSRQWHHSHPEHRLVADSDIVFAGESQLAVVAHAKHRQTCGYHLYGVPVPHVDWQVMLCDEQPSARVDMKSARVDLLGFDVLDRCRLAGRLIDRIHNDAILAAFEDLLRASRVPDARRCRRRSGPAA